MKCRGLWPAIGCVVLAACASQAHSVTPISYEGPLYDPVGEWKSAEPEAAAAPVRPRPRPPLRRMYDPMFEASEPPSELRRFTNGELERIAAVQDIVRAASRAHDVPTDMVNGIIWVESRFQVQARSDANACGLMQLMPGTAREVARELGLHYAVYDPEFNIQAGTYYFARMVDRFDGNVRLALAAYNIGPAVVDGWVRVQTPLPWRSQAYVDNVFVAARAFRTYEALSYGALASR
jgi:soluble lytic murein transglycosylase-like protein